MEYRQLIGKTELFPHIVVLEPANREGLVQHKKLAVLEDEIIEWLEESSITWSWHYSNVIGFKHKEDAMAFMLRWG